MSKIVKIYLIATALCFLSSGCEGKREHLIQGRTMGTTYHIKIVSDYFQSVSGLKEKIEKRLVDINASMSTYQKDSEISRFNKFNQTGRKFKRPRRSTDFPTVPGTARSIRWWNFGVSGERGRRMRSRRNVKFWRFYPISDSITSSFRTPDIY